VSGPELSVVVVAWRSRADALELVEAFPDDSRFELAIVDNSGELARDVPARPRVRILGSGANLGFAGGSNLGAAATGAPLLLFLNPDARPAPGALDALVEGFRRHREAAGLAPRLIAPDGTPQARWQLKPLPTAASLVAHAFFWNPTHGPRREPLEGERVEQPAAAALALRRTAFEAVGGFDAGYHPAWFEDVDLARRLAERGERIVYLPAATFVHRGGGSVPALGYGGFLTAYDRNLARYLRLHHGRGWELVFRALVPAGALLRTLALPLRRPRRAASRREAAGALFAVASGAWRGWPAGDLRA
jgi:N-acetylglucosaminyl-diphospho-decaprenol L-rhamnosyltransferase